MEHAVVFQKCTTHLDFEGDTIIVELPMELIKTRIHESHKKGVGVKLVVLDLVTSQDEDQDENEMICVYGVPTLIVG